MRPEEEAVALRVPHIAHRVWSPQVRWGSLRESREDLTAIVFWLDDDDSLGRVTFEGLDAIRVARGEFEPYEDRAGHYEGWEWAYVIENSRWLEERHRYEDHHYDYPLIESHDHYLFRFHDEFVEAIARGIWLDEPEAARPFARPAAHPLWELPPDTLTERTRSSGVEWELRTNPIPGDQLVHASRLCSQRLFQYNLIGHGRNAEWASVWLRTRRGVTVSTFVTGPFDVTRIDAAGVATALTFQDEWERLVEGLATRRRKGWRTRLRMKWPL
jgi:hypothetical protein